MMNGKPIQFMEISYNESCVLVSDCMTEIVDGIAIKFYNFQNDVANSSSDATPIA